MRLRAAYPVAAGVGRNYFNTGMRTSTDGTDTRKTATKSEQEAKLAQEPAVATSAQQDYTAATAHDPRVLSKMSQPDEAQA